MHRCCRKISLNVVKLSRFVTAASAIEQASSQNDLCLSVIFAIDFTAVLLETFLNFFYFGSRRD